jgi:spore coat protein CotH
LLLGVLAVSIALLAASGKPQTAPGSSLFAGTNVLRFALEISAEGMSSLRQEPRDWVKATLRFDNQAFTNVAVHIKGSQGSLQGIDNRPALTVSLSRFAEHQRLYGFRKVHFNNSAEDPSFMTEILCSELCRKAGLPAARSCHATLTLNGRNLGLYVLKEGLTKEFLAQFFTKTSGNLYDGGFRKDIDQPLELIGGDGPENQSDRLALLNAAREPDPRRRWQRLQGVLDTDRFVTLLAMSVIMWNWDGYPMARNNYRIYHDPGADKMVFIPHGLDQMFWEPQGTIYPNLHGIVAVAVMSTPEGRRLYRERLKSLHQNTFRVKELDQRIDELVSVIRPYRSNAPQQGARLKRLIDARWQSLEQQLNP